MPSFLSLPVDLRKIIIGLVVSTPMTTIEDACDIGEWMPYLDIQYRSKDDGYGVRYAQPFQGTNSSHLMLVNRQLSMETQQLLDSLWSKLVYIVDVALVSQSYIQPTWLSIPVLSRSMHKVHASIRITKSLRSSSWAGFQDQAPHPPHIIWSLYSLLERFLKCGPVGLRKLPRDQVIRVRVLEIDVITPPDIPLDWFPPPGMSLAEANEYSATTTHSYTLHPDFLVSSLLFYINTLLRFFRDSEDWGSILYERVGILRLTQDGIVIHEWKLTENLHVLSVAPFHDENHFLCWRNWRMVLLEDRGFNGFH